MVARGHGSTNLPLARHGSEAGHTDTEEEFVFMKGDLKRVKAVLREKLVMWLPAQCLSDFRVRCGGDDNIRSGAVNDCS